MRRAFGMFTPPFGSTQLSETAETLIGSASPAFSNAPPVRFSNSILIVDGPRDDDLMHAGPAKR